jgi:fibronectin type 3 domain-containing protein
VLQAKSGDRSVLLRWEAAGNHEEPTRFNIYRRPEGEEFPLAPVNPVPVTKNSFLDKEVQNGVCYYYQVRATVSHIPPWIESRESPEMKAVPADRVPPAPPRGLDVITGTGIVRLFWKENREADIKGYHIYRKVVNQRNFVQIGDIRHPMSIYTDDKVQAGRVYEYFVAAYDSSPLSNESRPSKIVKGGY